MPHDPYKRRIKMQPTVIPTDIIEMYCLKCGKRYARDINGLMFNHDGTFKPCTNGSMNISLIEKLGANAKCLGTDYRVVRLVELAAMPIGRINCDLRPES
jgi:hypothetical protein